MIEAEQRLWGSVTMEMSVEKKVSHSLPASWRGDGGGEELRRRERKTKQSRREERPTCGPDASLLLLWQSLFLFFLFYFVFRSSVETMKRLQIFNMGWLNSESLSCYCVKFSIWTHSEDQKDLRISFLSLCACFFYFCSCELMHMNTCMWTHARVIFVPWWRTQVVGELTSSSPCSFLTDMGINSSWVPNGQLLV